MFLSHRLIATVFLCAVLAQGILATEPVPAAVPTVDPPATPVKRKTFSANLAGFNLAKFNRFTGLFGSKNAAAASATTTTTSTSIPGLLSKKPVRANSFFVQSTSDTKKTYSRSLIRSKSLGSIGARWKSLSSHNLASTDPASSIQGSSSGTVRTALSAVNLLAHNGDPNAPPVRGGSVAESIVFPPEGLFDGEELKAFGWFREHLRNYNPRLTTKQVNDALQDLIDNPEKIDLFFPDEHNQRDKVFQAIIEDLLQSSGKGNFLVRAFKSWRGIGKGFEEESRQDASERANVDEEKEAPLWLSTFWRICPRVMLDAGMSTEGVEELAAAERDNQGYADEDEDGYASDDDDYRNERGSSTGRSRTRNKDDPMCNGIADDIISATQNFLKMKNTFIPILPGGTPDVYARHKTSKDRAREREEAEEKAKAVATKLTEAMANEEAMSRDLKKARQHGKALKARLDKMEEDARQRRLGEPEDEGYESADDSPRGDARRKRLGEPEDEGYESASFSSRRNSHRSRRKGSIGTGFTGSTVHLHVHNHLSRSRSRSRSHSPPRGQAKISAVPLKTILLVPL